MLTATICSVDLWSNKPSGLSQLSLLRQSVPAGKGMVVLTFIISKNVYLKNVNVRIRTIEHCRSLHGRCDPGLPEGSGGGAFLLTELEEPGGVGRAGSSGAHEDSLRHYVRSSWCRESPQQRPPEGLR